MPTPEFGRIGDNPSLSDVVDYVYKLQKELNFLLTSLDTLNISRLDAKVVKTGTLDTNFVTVRSDLAGSAYLQIDTNGIRGNNGTLNTFEIDTAGNAYFRGNITSDATITGATIRTGAVGSDRIEMSGGKFRGITAAGSITGMYFDIGTIAGTGIADIHFYHNDADLLQIYDEITFCTIKPGAGASTMGLGVAGKTTYAYGTWSFISPSDLLFNTATAAVAGTATLPANPVEFISIPINGTVRRIPYYAI